MLFPKNDAKHKKKVLNMWRKLSIVIIVLLLMPTAWAFAHDGRVDHNGDFSRGDETWVFSGSLQHDASNQEMQLYFPSGGNISGAMTKDIPYSAPAAAPFQILIDVRNDEAVDQTVRVWLRDNATAQEVACFFNVPANTAYHTYTMHFTIPAYWAELRYGLKPMTLNDNGVTVDNISVMYRPSQSYPTKACILPNFINDIPSDDELVGADDVQLANVCSSLDWFDTNNWNGYLPTSEIQFVFDPFEQTLLSNGAYDQNGDGTADTLYDALSYDGLSSTSATLIREAVIAMLNDRYDSNHAENWWAIEIDVAEALAAGEPAMAALAQQYALSNAACQ